MDTGQKNQKLVSGRKRVKMGMRSQGKARRGDEQAGDWPLRSRSLRWKIPRRMIRKSMRASSTVDPAQVSLG
jgi:hypothetical protein